MEKEIMGSSYDSASDSKGVYQEDKFDHISIPHVRNLPMIDSFSKIDLTIKLTYKFTICLSYTGGDDDDDDVAGEYPGLSARAVELMDRGYLIAGTRRRCLPRYNINTSPYV